MGAYVSTELNMVKENAARSYEIAMLERDFLRKGGVIEVLQGPSFVPPPARHEPPPRRKAAKPLTPKAVAEPEKVTKMTLREIEREERAEIAERARAELVEQVKKLAETMNYSQAILRTGLSRKTLFSMAKEHGFKFQPAGYTRGGVDGANDADLAKRIKAFMKAGLTRSKAMENSGLTFKPFLRILARFNIDYPKAFNSRAH